MHHGRLPLRKRENQKLRKAASRNAFALAAALASPAVSVGTWPVRELQSQEREHEL